MAMIAGLRPLDAVNCGLGDIARREIAQTHGPGDSSGALIEQIGHVYVPTRQLFCMIIGLRYG
ncbi:hypothetical protein J2R96_001988 [Bradyrhizobium elkanii]|nr:hypothetical protein [Bradyrhizobium elkanii]